jgi:outer membrane protein TolC
MNPQPKFNRITQTLENLQQGASTIQMVTQAPLDIINATTELTTATTELTNAIKQDENLVNKGKEAPEPDKLKADESTAKVASAGLELIDLDLDPDD